MRISRLDLCIAGSLALILGTLVVSQATTAAAQLSVAREIVSDFGSPTSLPIEIDGSQHGSGGLQLDTVRQVGVSASAEYYVALDQRMEVCLVALERKSEFTASACAAPDAVASGQLGLRYGGSLIQGSEVHLLPDGARLDHMPAGWNVVGENLLVAVTADAQAFTVELNGKTATMEPIGEPDELRE